jgi:quercetin dioxygenase-like cupin family protein
MQTRDLTELVHFSEEEARRSVLYDSERVFAQVICLQDNQLLGPVSDPESEGIVAILAGEVAAQIGKGRARLKQWETALVPPGDDLTLHNASAEPAVVLLVLAPPPRGGEDGGDAA